MFVVFSLRFKGLVMNDFHSSLSSDFSCTSNDSIGERLSAVHLKVWDLAEMLPGVASRIAGSDKPGKNILHSYK